VTGRPSRRALLAGGLALALGTGRAARAAEPVGDLLAGLWPQAEAAGIGRSTFEDAVRGVTFDERVAALSRRQGEFSRPVAAYVEGAAGGARLATGRALLRRHGPLLAGIEARTGVPGPIVVAIWGMESEFGAATGGFDAIRSLATLGSLGERGDFFRAELLAAFRILEEDHVERARLTGSWAGALGQTQFMPSSFLRFAVDGDGDGRRDIWRSAPDALASMATFLARSGWRAGLPAVVEVTVPAGADLRVHRRDLSDWAALGIAPADGTRLSGRGASQLVFLAGRAGPAFLLTENFEAIRAYNTSDAYALAVARLAARIAGGGALARPWPKEETLTGDERREIHRRLAARDLYAGTQDGKFGAQTRDAVRRFQIAAGLVPDGYAGRATLDALRAR
jgi:membrane-bound lytic murein transglycosylase B